MPMKPISGQVFATSVERKEDDRPSESTQVERQPATELGTADDSRLVEANPTIAVSGGVDGDASAEVVVEKEEVATGVRVRHNRR